MNVMTAVVQYGYDAGKLNHIQYNTIQYNAKNW